MKKTKMMILAAMAILTAACSSDDESQKQSAQPESGWSELVIPSSVPVHVPAVPCV